MNEEIKIIIKAVTDSAKKAINDVSKELEGMSKGAKGASAKMGAAFKAIGKGAMIAVAAIAAVVTALVTLGKNTLQFQKEQARLNAAFEAAGSSAKQAAESYQGLYRFLGDSGKASEAAAHLAKITTNQQDLAEWTKIAQGVYATFGDSLPIEGLTEAANETIRVGQVTGTMADALNWAGVSEDEFNAKLAATNSLEEREALLRSTLNGLYSDAAEIYERNNKALLDYNESQARLDTTMASAGAAVLPLMTALNNLGAAFFSALKPALDAIIPPIATFVNWIAKAIQSVTSFFSALTGKSTTIKAVGEIGGAAAGAAKSLGGAAQGAKNLGSGMKGAEKAADGAAKAAEEVKKSTQGFDELNIVSSGKTSSGGSGGSGGGGGGSSSPGYAGGGILPTATFGTEVEEMEGETNSFAERVKKIFGDLKTALNPSIEAWGSAFEELGNSWERAKPNYEVGVTHFKNSIGSISTYVVTEFLPDLTNAFSVNIAPIFADVGGFVVEEFGKSFELLGSITERATNNIVLPALENVKTAGEDIFNSIGTSWEKHGDGVLSEASEALGNLRGHIDKLYEKVEPFFTTVNEVVSDTWDNHLAPMFDELFEDILIIAEDLLELYNETIAPFVDWIIENVVPPIVDAAGKIVKEIGTLIGAAADVAAGVMESFTGLVKFVSGVLTGDWEQAWEGIKMIFSGAKDSIGAIFGLMTGNSKQNTEEMRKDLEEKYTEMKKKGIAEIAEMAKTNPEKAEQMKIELNKKLEAMKTEGLAEIEKLESGSGGYFETMKKKATEKVGEMKKNVKDKFDEIKADIKSWWDEKIVGWFNQHVKPKFTASYWKEKFDTIKESAKSAFNGIITVIEKAINNIIKKINTLSWDIPDWVPGIGGGKFGFNMKTVSIPRLAEGGIVTDSILANIGEKGKEAVLPLENNTGWMDALADRIAARNNNPTKLILKVGEKELGWATIGAINGITEQTGGLQLVL